MRSSERLLAILSLFSVEKYEWTVEDAAETLGVSVSTAYRYFKSLVEAGILTATSASEFGLGPAIIALDRLIQACDPTLQAAIPVMMDLLVPNSPPASTLVLARLYRDKVICVHQIKTPGPQSAVSFERGRPMPLLRGATSKVILANLKPRSLKALYDDNNKEVMKSGLGKNWSEFKANLRRIRREGFYIAHGEVDEGRVGISAPVFGASGSIQGSLTVAVTEPHASEATLRRLSSLVTAGAREIEAALSEQRPRLPERNVAKQRAVGRRQDQATSSRSREKVRRSSSIRG
jgi:DNA-binding IclR family transcriptional regulator